MKKGLCLIILILAVNSYAQTNTQTIRGKVADANSKEALIGATIKVLNVEPLIGASCDLEGNFVLDDVPVGRQNIEVRMLGYTTFVVNELLVSTGKEPFLEISLELANKLLDEVRIKVRKDAPLNSMTTLSCR